MGSTTLADAFVAASGNEEDRDELELALSRAIDAAQLALDGSSADPILVASVLGGLGKPLHAIDPEIVSEVVLAAGCAEGSAGALARFEERYVAIVPAAIAHMKLGAAQVDEVRQIVRDRLLVADGGAPKILGYAGRGSLRGLVKVIAVRAAIDRVRREAREAPEDELADLPSAHDPELTFLKETYRAAFAQAFSDAVRSLEPRERNLLRMHHLHGVTLDDLAKMYGMHRATVVRQLAKVRGALLSETHKGLRKTLRIGPSELESVMDLIRSRFEISVDGLLRSVERSRP